MTAVRGHTVRSPSPWRSSDFRLVWAGGLVNDIGDWLLLVALPVFVFAETRSGTATAALFVIELVVAVTLGPIGGSLVDRWDLRRTLVATNIAQAVTLAPLLAVTADRLWPAFAVAAVQSALTQINNPAKVALLPRLVEPERLAVANAANSTSASLARLIGSPLGGLAVGVGGLEAVVAIDGASFLVVAVAMALVRADTAPVSVMPGADDGDRTGVRAGLRVIRRRRPLPALLGIVAVAQIAQGFFVVLFIVFVIEELDGGGAEIGVIRGTMAIGAIVGALLVARWSKRVGAPRLLAAGLLGLGLVSALFWNAPFVTTALWVYVVLFAASGVPGSAFEVGLYTTVQRASPADMLGRAVGVMGACGAAGSAIGSLVAGVLVDRLELTVLLDVQTAIYVACGVLAMLFVAGATDDDL